MSVTDEQKAFVSYHTRLQLFLYVLLTEEHCAKDTLDTIMKKHLRGVVGVAEFGEPHLEEYTRDLADRILRGEPHQGAENNQ